MRAPEEKLSAAARDAAQVSVPAVLMRGGTSKGLVFRREHLPDRSAWDALFLAAMGSPDPYARQLDGLGGGVSSLSKVCVVGPPSRPDADLDYTFAQVSVARPVVDYTGNCGNMSSAIGPFGVAEGLVRVSGGRAQVRIHNTNTGRIIVSRFDVEGGRPVEVGDTALPGVAGTGARIELAFLAPGGAVTGKLLPTGRARDRLDVPGVGEVEVSLVDAANPVVFVEAAALGLSGVELPVEVERQPGLLDRFEALRRAGSVAMGVARDADEAARRLAIPIVAIVSPPRESPTLSGERLPAAAADVTVRMISSQQPHRATPLTAALCAAAAAYVPGTLVHALADRSATRRGVLRIGHPSGVTEVSARVSEAGGQVHVEEASVVRTARRLMQGEILVPRAWLTGVR
jgi:2-methylaconitate cis-trans-isomerase PrpF